MKTAKEIAKKHCLKFIRNEFPDMEFEDHYNAPEWVVDAMKEYAKQALELAIKSFPSHEHPDIAKSIMNVMDEIE